MKRLIHTAAMLGLTVTAASAGTICGTVRDARTTAPVPQAGVFVRTPAGAYTGLYGASNASGSFCIPAVPAGTYDLEFLVDDHRIAFLRGVVVTTTTTEVSADARLPMASLAQPSPNPAREQLQLRWTLARPGALTLRVLDSSGRLVAGWQDGAASAGSGHMTWNLTGIDRRPLPAGTYHVQLEAAGERRTRSFVRVR